MGHNRSPRTPYTRRVTDTTRDEREEAYAAILALWDAGASPQWLARRTGLALKTVDTMLRGVQRKLGRRAYDAVVRLYEEEFINGS